MTKRCLFTALADVATALQAECDRLCFSPAQIALAALVERLDVLIDQILDEGVQDGALGVRQTTSEVPEPLRLYRWADAPPALRALSDAGGGEVLLAVVPAGWLDEAVLRGLPHGLWMLLESGSRRWQPEQDAWGRVQRAAHGGSVVVIVSRP